MLDFRPIFFILGILLSTLAVAMGLPAIVDAAVSNDDWKVFALSSGFTLFIGVMLMLTTRTEMKNLSIRQAFLLTTLSWMILPTFAALPFTFADLELDYTDAFFEAMSGITTTGSTVMKGLDSSPPGILLWRSLLQWLGGVGIVVMAVSVLPMLQVGGMQLFRMEFAERMEKALPRAAQIGAWISVIYLALTLTCALLYWLSGMGGFDAVNHAMTTVATGGFSTHDASMSAFSCPVNPEDGGVFINGLCHIRAEILIDGQVQVTETLQLVGGVPITPHMGPLIEAIATVFMILGSLPFLLYLQAIRSSIKPLITDSQVRWFFVILGLAVTSIILNLIITEKMVPLDAIRYASFNITSIMTGTGYASADYGTWGAFALILFYLLMFIGGCAGSTTCGIKVFRFQVLYETAKRQLRSLLQPHGVFIAYYNGKPIPYQVMDSVTSFFFLFAMTFAILAAALGMTGQDFLTATSGAGTALANVGPGLGPIIGPEGNFAALPQEAKWILSAGMLLGRLEIFTVLILLTRHFWRN